MQCNEKVSEWVKDLTIKKQIVDDMQSALNFAGESKIRPVDLVIVLNEIRNYPGQRANIDEVRTRFSYTAEEFGSLIERLKKLGEIYNPNLGLSNDCSIIEII